VRTLLVAVATVAALFPRESPQAQEVDARLFLTLERTWNDAHLRGDTVVLADLWADDLRIEVSGMSEISKSEALAFWRTGR
jgi:hypothetical protein